MPFSTLLFDYLSKKNFKTIDGKENLNFVNVEHNRKEIMIRRLPRAAGYSANYKHVVYWFEDKMTKYKLPFPENIYISPPKEEKSSETHGFISFPTVNLNFKAGMLLNGAQMYGTQLIFDALRSGNLVDPKRLNHTQPQDFYSPRNRGLCMFCWKNFTLGQKSEHLINCHEYRKSISKTKDIYREYVPCEQCGDDIKISQFDNHKKTCRAICQYCSERYWVQHIEAHRLICDKRMTKCMHCSKHGKYVEFEKHSKKCVSDCPEIDDDYCPVCLNHYGKLGVNDQMCSLPCSHSICITCLNTTVSISKKPIVSNGIPLVDPISGAINALPAGAEFDDEPEDEAESYINWLQSNLFFSTGTLVRDPVRESDLEWDFGDNDIPTSVLEYNNEYDVPIILENENPLDGMPLKCPICRTFVPLNAIKDYLN